MDGVVTALGHAGLRIDAPGVRVLADPWVSSGGAFLGSWFPFPDNAHLPGPVLGHVDVVVVSHEHLDHLDLPFLASLPPDVPIVVPRYPSTIMQRRLRAAGRRRVVVLDAWQRYPLGDRGDWLTVIPEQCPMSHDAAVLFSVGGAAVLHTNDARISLSQVRRAVEEVGRPDRRDGRADVRRQLAPGPLRVRRRRPRPDQRGQAGRQVQGRHPAGPLGAAPARDAVRRPALLPRPRPVRAQQRAARPGHLPGPGRGARVAGRAAAAAAHGAYLLPGDKLLLDGLARAPRPAVGRLLAALGTGGAPRVPRGVRRPAGRRRRPAPGRPTRCRRPTAGSRSASAPTSSRSARSRSTSWPGSA